VKPSSNESVKVQTAKSADRRQFLRNAMRLGPAAALLLTLPARKMLAMSLALDPEQMEAARRAQLAKGNPCNIDRNAGGLDAEATQPLEMKSSLQDCPCTSCTGTCTGHCTGCQGTCEGCQGTCSGGCHHACGGCDTTCSGYCKGCSGINL